MASDPTTITDIFDVLVDFVPTLAPGRFAFTNPTVIAEFEENASFPDRIKAYTGTVSQMQAALVADGFATTSDTYRQVTSARIQVGGPGTIYVGRKDPIDDADWGEAVAAVRADANSKGLTFYAFTAATRDPAEIEAIADYLEGDPNAKKFAFYLGQTDNANVFANNPGNVALNILAKNYVRTALLWHDPETASGYGPAVLQSVVGPFNIPNASTIELRIDGGATQTFTFNATAATLLGGNTETFAVSDGDTLLLAMNGGSAQTITASAAAATVLSGNSETYNFVDGDTLFVRVDGGAAQTATFNGTAAVDLGTGTEPFTINAADQLDLQIDGGATQSFIFTGAETTAQDVADLINATATGFVAADNGGAVELTSNRLGTSSEVEILGSSTAGLLTELGLPAGSETGTGFAAFLDAATAAEVAAEINADTTDITAADDGGQVRITSDTVGTSSRIQVTGGTSNVALGFDTNEFAGSGDFADASVATALEIVNLINANALGVTASVDTGAVRLTSDVLGTSSEIDVDASALATVLGFSLTAVQGSGDFVNAAQATASEVATEISLTLTGAVASSAGSRVIITSNTSGTSSTVEAVGGSLLGVLRFTDATTGASNLATGTGVLEDFADCAWMGFCITFDLDAEDGAAIWDNATLLAPSPTGAGTVPLLGDVLAVDPEDAQVIRTRLQETLRVNTYEPRFSGRNETHRGTLLNNQLGAGGYIDVRTTIDWLQIRIVEEFKNIQNQASDKKIKYPYGPDGIAVYDLGLRRILERSGRNGHTFYDSSPLDLDDVNDTGIIAPTVSGQTQVDINGRFVDGFRARQQIQGAIQGAGVIVDLIGPISEIE